MSEMDKGKCEDCLIGFYYLDYEGHHAYFEEERERRIKLGVKSIEGAFALYGKYSQESFINNYCPVCGHSVNKPGPKEEARTDIKS